MNCFEGVSADGAWKAAFKSIAAGTGARQPGRGGPTTELLHAFFAISNPRQRWVVSRYPAINPAFAIAEVIWIVNGRNDASFINHWNPRLPSFAGSASVYHGAYGFRLRKAFGFDQLERAYRALEACPESRQIVLQIWDPTTDFPHSDGSPTAPDIPCNVCAFPKVRAGKLEWLQIMRSNDLHRGLPYNFFQFTSLQEIVAGWLGLEVGAYTHISDSLHVYDSDDSKAIASKPEREAVNHDMLALSWGESREVFDEMARLLDAMTLPGISLTAFRTIFGASTLPQAYTNLLMIVAADSARRRGWEEVANELVASCDNLALVQVWNRWVTRQNQSQVVDSSKHSL